MSASSMSASSKLTIDLISDVVCPWCYIGKRLLEQAIALKPEIPVEVRFRPYFLNPWVPREGMSREDYLIAKFGSVERYNANNNRVVDAAAAVGLSYNRDQIKRQPNTLDCHRLILWAGAAGKAALMKQRLMEIYFSEGGDLSQSEVLVGAAADCGMDGDRIRALLASQQDVDEVEREAQSAKEAGIDGVPCFIIGGMIALSGAQSPDYLAAAIERATAEQAKRVAAE
jgi:predicted DsbA family dithiol-disulfide isomerase